jgi:hypothetical protein
MSDEFLGDRKKALEASFFARENARLLERMRSERRKHDAVDAIAAISRIDDRAILEKLVDLGIGPDTWAALSLVPLVEVAWASGRIEDKERHAILAAAADNGIAPGSSSYALLQNWLETRPSADLLAAWGAYAVELSARLSPQERTALRAELVERARHIAEATGGFLGLGSVSEAEKQVIAELEKPFA